MGSVNFTSVKEWHLSIPRAQGDDPHRSVNSVWSVIGIIESDKAHPLIIGNFYNKENNGYGLKGYDGMQFHGGSKPIARKQWIQIKRLNHGDQIKIILNMENGTMRYVINDKKYKVSFNVDTSVSYRLCVALCQHSQMRLHK
eukprot:220642_1